MRGGEGDVAWEERARKSDERREPCELEERADFREPMYEHFRILKLSEQWALRL